MDFFLTRSVKRSCCVDYKVIPRESVAKQHQFLVLEIRFRKAYRKARRVPNPRIKWWRLKVDAQAFFVDRLTKKANWEDEAYPSLMWNEMGNCIRAAARRKLVNQRA